MGAPVCTMLPMELVEGGPVYGNAWVVITICSSAAHLSYWMGVYLCGNLKQTDVTLLLPNGAGGERSNIW